MRNAHADAAGDGDVAFARQQALAGEVHGDQRRRACRLHRDRRALEVEAIGELRGDVILVVADHGQQLAGRARSADLVADVHWLVCREICIPGKAQLGLTLPVEVTARADAKRHARFEATRKEIPQNAPAQWKASTHAEGGDFVLSVETGQREKSAMFFPLVEQQIDNDAAQKMNSNARGFQLRLKKSDGLTLAPATLQGLLTLSSGQSYVVDAPVSGAVLVRGSPAQGHSPQSLWSVFGFAFLGGIILNLMPCVFPVLSLTVLGLTHLGHQEAKRSRIHGLV